MKIKLKNVIEVTDLNEISIEKYFAKFGEQYWNDTENIICIPLDRMCYFDSLPYFEFIGLSDVTLHPDISYIIIRMNP